MANFNRYLERKIYNPFWIVRYLKWRILYEKEKDIFLRENIEIDIIKQAYKFEYLSSNNSAIFNLFIDNITLFSKNEDFVNNSIELLSFYKQNSEKGFFKIINNTTISKNG